MACVNQATYTRWRRPWFTTPALVQAAQETLLESARDARGTRLPALVPHLLSDLHARCRRTHGTPPPCTPWSPASKPNTTCWVSLRLVAAHPCQGCFSTILHLGHAHLDRRLAGWAGQVEVARAITGRADSCETDEYGAEPGGAAGLYGAADKPAGWRGNSYGAVQRGKRSQRRGWDGRAPRCYRRVLRSCEGRESRA